MKKTLTSLSVLILVLFLSLSSSAFSKGGPPTGVSGGGSGTGSGGGTPKTSPDYGDLVNLLRDIDGVPVPADNGCPLQPLNLLGIPIPLDSECEIEPVCTIIGGCLPVEVDFGRTSMSRSPEDVLAAGLDEVISTIIADSCKSVSVGSTGRLELEIEVLNSETGLLETVYKTIDSARENLGIYVKLMRDGHIKTPTGVIADDHGDEITIRPSLDPLVDYAKFSAELQFLLPTTLESAEAENLTNDDLVFSSFFLAAAADKTGEITVNMVQYLNNILKIPNATNSLPGNPNFVDFRGVNYQRTSHFNKTVILLQRGATPGFWQEEEVDLLYRLGEINGSQSESYNIEGFVKSANDALRTIEITHNYAVPEDLW